MFTPTVFEILMAERRSVLSPAQRGTGNERVKERMSYYMGTKKNDTLFKQNIQKKKRKFLWPNVGHKFIFQAPF